MYVDVVFLVEYNGEEVVLREVGEGDRERFDWLVREKMGGRRLVFIKEIVGMIEMLCIEEVGWIMGSVVCVNGGMKMGIV